MNNKYVVFSPYFGKLPQWFPLWLKSCSYCKEIAFVVFTDDNYEGTVPKNVVIEKISFSSFKDKIQKKFDFNISLETPYKLCDYKPVYGYVFKEYLKNAQYWGYCDMDLIFGNICKFLPNDINDYDKISFLGHFCLYKNTEDNNKLFMFNIDNTINYKDILSNKQHFGFDEIGNYGINNIFKLNKKNIFNFEVNVADIDCRVDSLDIITYINGKFYKNKGERIFCFTNGNLESYELNGNKIKIKEYAYIHFQKRKMRVLLDLKVKNVYNEFIITYNSFCEKSDVDIFFIRKLQPRKTILPIKRVSFLWKAMKNRLKRYFIIRNIIKKG